MNLDKLNSKTDLAKELGLDENNVNFQWNAEQIMANWDPREVQKVKNKFFPKIVGAQGRLHLSVPKLLRRTRSFSPQD